ncbi:MAG: metallophosphoesterase [Phycisphaerae bacterium]|nr:metallophosphoesterase [Phycisphaerae bacterium]
MGCVVADIFTQAAELTSSDPHRQGNVLHLGSPEQVVITGDIHGNRENLTKILSYAASGGDAPPTLILQEIIHGVPDVRTGMDRSVELLLRAARLKISNPANVHILLGNHDVAQFTGSEITKEGVGVCKGFVEGVEFTYGDDAPAVLEAVMTFLRSLPLGIRFDNRVFVSHSLPSPNRVELAGIEILARTSQDEDFLRGKPAYEWVWGRNQTPEQLDELAAELDVDFFVLGHRHIDEGYLMIPQRAVAINSNTPRGVVCVFNGDDELSFQNIRKHLGLISKL